MERLRSVNLHIQRKISLSHHPLLSDSQSGKSEYIIKRFIGKNSNQYLLFSLPRRVRDHIHPWKRNTHTHTGHGGTMLLNEWLHGEEPFTTTSDWLLDSPYLCLFLGGWNKGRSQACIKSDSIPCIIIFITSKWTLNYN